MKLSELKENMILKDNTYGGFWWYTGIFNSESYHFYACTKCGKYRRLTHGFLHYRSIEQIKNDIAINDIGRFDQNLQYGTECVKDFIKDFDLNDTFILEENKAKHQG